MLKSRTLIHYLVIYTFTLLIASAAIITGVWAVMESRDFSNELISEKEVLTENKKHEVKTIIKDAVAYIESERENLESELKTILMQRVDEAVSLIENLNNTYASSLTSSEILNIAKEALRPIRFNNGRGYFFIVDLDGTELLYPVAPELEGKNLLQLQDSSGTYVIQKEIELVQTGGEGFVRDYWMKPGSERSSEKLTYLKAYLPLNIYVGTGEYLEDFEEEVQERITRTLTQIRIDMDEYIFGGTWDGVTIMGPATGSNNWDIQDSDGKYVVRELVKTAKNGSGFVSYRMPEGIDQPIICKTSYVVGIPGWQWYIGAGFDESKIDNHIEWRRMEMKTPYRLRVILISLIFVGLVMVNFLLVRILSKKINTNYSQFMTFFNNAKTDLVKIDTSRPSFQEFRTLAASANSMIDVLKDARDEIRSRLKEKEYLLQEIHHRVKNNLQIISSLLNLQKDSIHTEIDKRKLQESIDRIRVMASIHEHLYGSENLSSLNLRQFLKSMIDDLITVYSEKNDIPAVSIAAEDVVLGVDRAIPLCLIISELTTNALKYAGKTGNQLEIVLRLNKDNGMLNIELSDNGEGPKENFNPEDTHSLGLQLVYSLIVQLDGIIRWERGPGLVWIIQMPAEAM